MGRGRFELTRSGWNFIIGGFGLLLFGSLVDITDNFEALNRFVIIGDTETEAVLEKVVGYLGGFILLAIGLVRWIPSVQRLSDEIAKSERTTEVLRRQSRSSDLLRKIAIAANEIFDADQVMKVCIDEVCAYTGWPLGHVYEPSEDGSGELRPTKLWHLDDPDGFQAFRRVTEATRFPPGIGLPGRVLASGEPVWITDVTKDANFPRANMADDIGVKSGMAFPVLVGNQVVAVLEFFSENASEPDPQILEIMAQAGTQLGRAIERKRSEEARRGRELQVRLLMNSTAEAIYGIDLEGNCSFANPACTEMLGYDGAEELLGKSMHELIHHTRPDGTQYPPEECLMDHAFSKGKGTHVEDEVLWRRDGSSFPAEYWSYPVRRDGKIVGAAVTFLDITERKQAETALRAAHDTLEQRVGERTSELEKENAERKRAEATLLVSEHALQERVADLEEAHRKLERQGESLVRLADDLLVTRDEARGADRAKSEFLANMSHELRTPLNAIIGFSDIIKGERLGPVGNTRYREYADDIFESGQHLLALINGILDLSKIESGLDEIKEENIDIPEIARSVMKLVMEIARTGNIELELDVSDGIPVLHADERKVKQILLNLLSNAIKFTPGGGKVTLKIWPRTESGYVFQVIDTGIGIALENIPMALAPFQQIESDLNRKHEGTGLGLSLTKSLVEMHGGSMDLQSELGVGTTVTVRFPAERVVHPPRHSNSEGASPGANTSPIPSEDTSPRKAV